MAGGQEGPAGPRGLTPSAEGHVHPRGPPSDPGTPGLHPEGHSTANWHLGLVGELQPRGLARLEVAAAPGSDAGQSLVSVRGDPVPGSPFQAPMPPQK